MRRESWALPHRAENALDGLSRPLVTTGNLFSTMRQRRLEVTSYLLNEAFLYLLLAGVGFKPTCSHQQHPGYALPPSLGVTPYAWGLVLLCTAPLLQILGSMHPLPPGNWAFMSN